MGDVDDANSGSIAETVDILLVEPNPGDTRLFTESLRDAQLLNTIHAVTCGADALDFVRQCGAYSDASEPDLILLEPQLPDKTGADLLAELREDPDLRDVPVVVLTSSATGEHIVKSQGLEADAYVQKPVEEGDFVTFVHEIEEFWFAIVRTDGGEE